MTEKPGRLGRFTNNQPGPNPVATETLDGDIIKNSTSFKVKKFTSSAETIGNNVCNCWVCEELKKDRRRKKIVQRQNFLLPVIIGFEQ